MIWRPKSGSPTMEAFGFWYGKGRLEFRTPAVTAQGQGQSCRAEPVQCQSTSTGTTSVPSFPFLLMPPYWCQSEKDGWRVGKALCPSPPSGAAYLCQDVSLHIVMKGVIKVTAAWSVAYILPPSLCIYFPSNLLHIMFVWVRSQHLVQAPVYFPLGWI